MTMTMVQFDSLEAMIKAIHGMYDESRTYAQYLELREYAVEGKADILAMLNKCTKAQLMKYYTGYSDVKKDKLVKSVYETLLSCLALSPSISVDYFNGETYEQALMKAFELATESEFLKCQAEEIEKANALKKALSNPETLSEFSTFVRYRGMGALNSEQLARYDEIRTDRNRTDKVKELERKAQLTAVNLQGLEFSLHNSFHAKKQIPLWVVQLNGRVESEIFKDLDSKAKTLDGYYSSYRGQGAIPGFTFTKEDNAKAFMRLQTENVDASDIQKQKQADRVLHRADTLEDKGSRLEDSATESLTRDRKDNTARRARMASSAEATAMGNIEFAQTMQIISDGLKGGTIKYLDRLQNYTELEELYNILGRAKWAYLDDHKEIKKDDFELIPEVVDYAKFPFPYINIENFARVIYQLISEKGKKLAGSRLLKMAVAAKKAGKDHFYITGSRSVEDYKTVLCSYSRTVSRYELDRYKYQLDRYTRIKRLAIDEPHELRAALRELVTVRTLAVLDPEIKRAREIKELERKFVNMKLDGFFPTPEDLAAETAAKAQLEPGQRVGEFSAGLGHLAQAILNNCPDVDLHLVEINPSLCEALRLKGFENVTCADFTKLAAETDFGKIELFDRIVLNPPFENLQDIAHVVWAWNFLKPGGRLVAIMAANKEGDRANIQEFREWMSEYGSSTDNEPGAFLSAFRPTGVNTITVILDKPE
jgi:phospholipid N-methyltransferase